jgi:hypothetical protein
VRRIGAISAGSGCQIAYLGGSPEQPVGAAARAVAGAPVLTVTDVPGSDPVAIRFVIKANRVRFEIDQRVASVAGLNVSSKLLNLAVEVMR